MPIGRIRVQALTEADKGERPMMVQLLVGRAEKLDLHGQLVEKLELSAIVQFVGYWGFGLIVWSFQCSGPPLTKHQVGLGHDGRTAHPL